MVNNPARRGVRLQAKCVEIEGTRDVRPLPNYNDNFYPGVKVRNNDLRHEGILQGDIAIFAMGRTAKRGDLVVTGTPFGCQVEHFEPQCDCRLLGVVVRTERDYLSAI